MNLSEIKSKLHSSEYDFLRSDLNLGENIILLGLGGSHAYGMNNENSDLDIRGIATNSFHNMLIGNDFEEVVNVETDTTVYSFDKMIKLLCSCNPNTIEILGLKPEHYLYLAPVGQALIDNRSMFLSKRAVHSFGGYANTQLRRLENKAARLVSQSQMEANILKSIEHAYVDFKEKYFYMPSDAIKLYIDAAINEDYDSEIFMDISLKHYPLRDYRSMWNDIHNIVKSYNKIGKRNEKAISHDKLGKHMAHLVRLYLMCFDILEKGEIITYREKEHDFLMRIRNGYYLDEQRQPTREFYEIVDALEDHLDYLKDHTYLPDSVDMKRVNDFRMCVNKKVCIDAIG